MKGLRKKAIEILQTWGKPKIEASSNEAEVSVKVEAEKSKESEELKDLEKKAVEILSAGVKLKIKGFSEEIEICDESGCGHDEVSVSIHKYIDYTSGIEINDLDDSTDVIFLGDFVFGNEKKLILRKFVELYSYVVENLMSLEELKEKANEVLRAGVYLKEEGFSYETFEDDRDEDKTASYYIFRDKEDGVRIEARSGYLYNHRCLNVYVSKGMLPDNLERQVLEKFLGLYIHLLDEQVRKKEEDKLLAKEKTEAYIKSFLSRTS